MAEAAVIRAPRAEELTSTMVGLAGAGIGGALEGLIVKVAPRLGAAGSVLHWTSLIGAPMGATIGSLFTRGIVGNVLTGVAAGGFGILGFLIPEMVSPSVGRRAPTPTPTRTPIISGTTKQISTGQRVQTLASRSAVGQLPANAGVIPIMEEEGILV